jgi:hypothetical protein
MSEKSKNKNIFKKLTATLFMLLALVSLILTLVMPTEELKNLINLISGNTATFNVDNDFRQFCLYTHPERHSGPGDHRPPLSRSVVHSTCWGYHYWLGWGSQNPDGF